MDMYVAGLVVIILAGVIFGLIKHQHKQAKKDATTLLNAATSNPELAKRLIERLYSLDKNRWLSYGHQFNSWEFPIDFYDLIPEWWNKKGGRYMDRRYEVIHPVIDVIEREFGHKASLHYHNVTKGSMTAGEFEFWYANWRGDTPNYYERRSQVEQIQWWQDDVYKRLVDAGLCSPIKTDSK